MAFRARTETKTILLVEDEDLVSDLTKRILEKSGYSVLSAANGKEALDLYERDRESISLVILDLIMPEMSGEQCLKGLHEINPSVKVLVISGHPVTGQTRKTIESKAKGFIGKPYKMKQLLAAVRDALESQ